MPNIESLELGGVTAIVHPPANPGHSAYHPMAWFQNTQQ